MEAHQIMASLSKHHQELDSEGKGRCSVPMWSGGLPDGFCDEEAYGPQEKDQMRYVEFINGKWWPGYCSGLACYRHGGPKKKN